MFPVLHIYFLLIVLGALFPETSLFARDYSNICNGSARFFDFHHSPDILPGMKEVNPVPFELLGKGKAVIFLPNSSKRGFRFTAEKLVSMTRHELGSQTYIKIPLEHEVIFESLPLVTPISGKDKWERFLNVHHKDHLIHKSLFAGITSVKIRVRDFYNLLNSGNIYNFVITENSLILARTSTRFPQMSDYARHLILSNFSPYVRFAGTIKVSPGNSMDKTPVITVTNDSDTYMSPGVSLKSVKNILVKSLGLPENSVNLYEAFSWGQSSEKARGIPEETARKIVHKRQTEYKFYLLDKTTSLPEFLLRKRFLQIDKDVEGETVVTPVSSIPGNLAAQLISATKHLTDITGHGISHKITITFRDNYYTDIEKVCLSHDCISSSALEGSIPASEHAADTFNQAVAYDLQTYLRNNPGIHHEGVFFKDMQKGHAILGGEEYQEVSFIKRENMTGDELYIYGVTAKTEKHLLGIFNDFLKYHNFTLVNAFYYGTRVMPRKHLFDHFPEYRDINRFYSPEEYRRKNCVRIRGLTNISALKVAILFKANFEFDIKYQAFSKMQAQIEKELREQLTEEFGRFPISIRLVPVQQTDHQSHFDDLREFMQLKRGYPRLIAPQFVECRKRIKQLFPENFSGSHIGDASLLHDTWQEDTVGVKKRYSLKPSDWEFKTEGSHQMVLTYTGNCSAFRGKALKLIKRKKNRKPSSGAAFGANDKNDYRGFNELLIVNRTTRKLLGPYTNPGIVIPASREFIEIIARKSAPYRTQYMHNRSTPDEDSGFALLVPDHSQGIISFEIKPKTGFLPTSPFLKLSGGHPDKGEESLLPEGMSMYQAKQRHKVLKGRLPRISAYDPPMLFSGKMKPMSEALQALIDAPAQNSFKIFSNSAPVYGAEGTDINFENAVSSLFPYGSVAKRFRRDPECRLQHKKQVVKDILLRILTREKVLNRILALQKLDILDYKGATVLLNEIIAEKPDFTDNDVWDPIFLSDFNIHTEVLQHKLTFQDSQDSLSATQEISRMSLKKKVSLLRNYLMAMSARNISLFITLKNQINPNSPSNCPTIELADGRVFTYHISITDFGPVSLNKIHPKYRSVKKVVKNAFRFQRKTTRNHDS